VQPHGDVKPVEMRRLGDAGITRIERNPEQPSVNAVISVSAGLGRFAST